MNLGERILYMRTKANMSQGDLANALDVSRQSISKWETNSSIPELDKLLKMGDIFDISIDELVRGDKEKSVVELKDISNSRHTPQVEVRKHVGFGLISVGAIIFFLSLLLGDVFIALIFSTPFFITGLVSIFVRKHPALWCGWVLFLLIYTYLRYATGIRVWWIFNKWIYQDSLTAHAVIAWLMAIFLGGLVFRTYKVMNSSKFKKHKTVDQ